MAMNMTAPLSGIEASVLRQDVVANNVANVVTPGFTASRVNQVSVARGGAAVGSISRDTTPGPAEYTGRQLDLSPRADVYIQVEGPNGTPQFTRSLSLRIDRDGFLTMPEGLRISGSPQVAREAEGLVVTADGGIGARVKGALKIVGQLGTVRFQNPQGLKAVGGGRFEATAASGPAMPVVHPGIIPGELVGANTDLAAEIVQSIAASLGVEVNIEVLNFMNALAGTLVNMAR